MRVVKFRGKRLDTGEWVYGGIEYQSNIGKVYIAQDLGGISCVEVDPATVGQSTAIQRAELKARMAELDKAMDEYGYKEGISYNSTPVVTYEKIRSRKAELEAQLSQSQPSEEQS